MTPEDTSAVPSSQPASGAPPQRTTDGTVRWTPPSPEHMARMLPQYDRWEMLGRGGMGAVYRARQANLDRTVAIKILPPEAADDEAQFIERFKNEARTMAKLDHPAIVAVYDFGETSEGQLYFVMAYVDGTDVSKMIQQGRLPAEHALAITAHVCDALQYAHEHGVIHRDIKPANVLLNQEGAVKVADFGLAKMNDPAGGVGLTRSGTTLGTPDFVAPESLTLGMVADHRADLYAVGVMLYQMLTGRIPRGAWNPPSQIVPGIDPRFDAIVQKAMQHDREQRFQSAAEIRRALDEILTVPLVQVDERGQSSAAIPKQAPAHRPVAHRPTGAAGRASATPLSPGRTPAKSGKPLLPLVLGVLAVLAVGAWFFLKPATTPAQSSPPQQTTGASSVTSPSTAPAKAVSSSLEDPAAAVQNAGASKSMPPVEKAEAPRPAVAPSPGAPPSPGGSTVPLASSVMPPRSDAPSANPPPKDGGAPGSASPKLPAELATLDTQFQKLQTERVTAPFETDLAKLNTGYLGAVEREIAKEKAAGHLDGILALEAEKKLLAEKQPIPDMDDEKTPASLKALRATYRSAHAKLVAQRAANLKGLTDPLDKRLAQMEADFTKGDRVADAKTVRGYRVALAESVPGAPLSPGGSEATANPPPKAGGAPVNPAQTLALQDGVTNSLGMKFLPVKGTDVLFCIHETRRQDYAAYATEVPGVDGAWKNQQRDGIPCGGEDNHPVVGVSWEDAQKFCEWLGKKEGKTYRLPTDEEWSIAVGLGRLEKRPKGTTPELLNGKVTTEFPWGGDFPPKTKEQAGNYADSAWHEKFPTLPFIEGYADGFPTTAPVMSFKPNKAGLYDMGGNVWEWAEDWWNAAQNERVVRGASFTVYRNTLLSSNRHPLIPATRAHNYGFRCVLVVSSSAPAAAATPPPMIPPPARTVQPINPAATLALKDGITNTLGMKFLPVKGTDVLFCIHETRYQDYAEYAAASPGVNGMWKDQSANGFAPTENKEQHPVIRVSWEDAQAFCAWLSKKEGKTYRLPTDEEWSIAVGLGRAEKRPQGTTPAMLSRKESTEFPWGGDFPPKTKDLAGNYSDESRKAKTPVGDAKYLEGYDDGFPMTAPVMSFKPNKLGLYDLGGNVWEWCDDWYDNAQENRVLRGGCWGVEPGRGAVLSSNRVSQPPDNRSAHNGFRCVLVVSPSAPAAAAAATPPPVIPPPARTVQPINPAATLALKEGITNSLGMKFLPVKGTDVLFCIHETRYKDYAAYAADAQGVDGAWKYQSYSGYTITERNEDHPVTHMSWEDAQAFCAWLSKKEGKTYRLPTDEEWSIAVGLGHAEKRTKDTTPAMLSQKENTEFPWGGEFPPKTKDMAGNYSDESRKAKAPVGDAQYLEGYDDGFPTTAPVMSFKPNKLGLYDLGGNMWEWCEDWYDNAQKDRVLRGGSWQHYERGPLLSSNRGPRTPDYRNGNHGFRCVLVVSPSAR